MLTVELQQNVNEPKLCESHTHSAVSDFPRMNIDNRKILQTFWNYQPPSWNRGDIKKVSNTPINTFKIWLQGEQLNNNLQLLVQYSTRQSRSRDWGWAVIELSGVWNIPLLSNSPRLNSWTVSCLNLSESALWCGCLHFEPQLWDSGPRKGPITRFLKIKH